ncbi:MAG: hypothetical protein RR364_01275 [Lachnospiraceae bacterium]
MRQEITVVDGILFSMPQMAEKAQKELEGIKFVKEKLDMDNPEAVLQVYNRLRREKMFETPVGLFFLRDLQEYLRTIPFIKNEDIANLDFEMIVEKSNGENLSIKKEQMKARDLKTKIIQKEQKIKEKEVRLHRKNKDQKTNKKLQSSIILNVILAVVILVMMIISATSNSITIVNYENKLIDKYEKWESDLGKREKTIQEQEEKYNIPKE